MQAWQSIHKSLDHIEENLSDPLTVEGLSTVASLSPFYFQRLFSSLVGKPAMEYVKLRRLARAARLLTESSDRILDIALAVGFENHETFTRAFKAAYGVTPEEQRRDRHPLSHFIKPSIELRYRVVDWNVPLLVDDIVLEVRRQTLEEPRHFAGLSVEVAFAPGQPAVDHLGELWGRFHQCKGAVNGVAPGRCEAGVSTRGAQEGHIHYLAAIEVTTPTQQPEFENWPLPAGDYAVCCFEAENFEKLTTSALDKAIKYMQGTWLKQNNLRTDDFGVELYPDSGPEASYMELWCRLVD